MIEIILQANFLSDCLPSIKTIRLPKNANFLLWWTNFRAQTSQTMNGANLTLALKLQCK